MAKSLYELKRTFQETESGGEKPQGWSVTHKGRRIGWFATKAEAERLVKARMREASSKLLGLLESLH